MNCYTKTTSLFFSRDFNFESKHEVYIPFAEDIFAAIDDGSRTWADYRKNKKSMSEVD